MVTVPPLTVVGIAAPVESAERPFVSCTDEDASGAALAELRVTVARTPFGIVVVFRPQTRQVAVPVPFVQESVLFVAPLLAAMMAEVKSAVE